MEFEYNGNLLEDERITLVANEIIKKYSQVSLEKAKKAAMLEGRISNKKTLDDELNRLYNIMLVNEDNKEIVSIVYKDYLELLKSNYYSEESKKYINIVEAIYDYLKNDIEFPIITDYQ